MIHRLRYNKTHKSKTLHRTDSRIVVSQVVKVPVKEVIKVPVKPKVKPIKESPEPKVESIKLEPTEPPIKTIKPNKDSETLHENIDKLKSALVNIENNLESPRIVKSKITDAVWLCNQCNATFLIKNKKKHLESNRHRLCVKRTNSVDKFNKGSSPRN